MWFTYDYKALFKVKANSLNLPNFLYTGSTLFFSEQYFDDNDELQDKIIK